MLKIAKAIIAVTSVIMLATTGCTKKSSSSGSSATSNDVTISGSLATSSASVVSVNGVKTFSDIGKMAVSVADLKIYVIAFTSPPSIQEQAVNSDGSFSITIPGAVGATISMAFRDSEGTQVGLVEFVDDSKKDIDGNAKSSSSITFGGSVSLGAITLGEDGKVTINVSDIEQITNDVAVSSGVAFDPTGVWYMKAYDGTLPTGYQTVQAGAHVTGGDGGPTVGFPLTLLRFTGKSFTPGSGCSSTSCTSANGSVGSDDMYGLSIWGGNPAQGVGACGYKTGFTEAEALYNAHINITTLPTIESNAITFGAYNFGIPTGFCGGSGSSACTAPYNKPWMVTTATARWNQDDCGPVTITGADSKLYRGWSCKVPLQTGNWNSPTTTGTAYNIGLQGGCINATTGKPVNVTNWPSNGSCTSTNSSATYGAGFYTSTCNYTSIDHDNDSSTAAIDVTCYPTGGVFANANGTNPINLTGGTFTGRPTTLLSAGAACSSAGSSTDSATLAGYRCYADNYWAALNNMNGNTSCMREYNFDWSATVPADFARDDKRGKPKEAFITNVLSYTPDGQTATLEDTEREKFAVSTGASSSTFCELSRKTVISFKKVSATRLLVDLRQSGQMNSTSAACLSIAKDALSGKHIDGINVDVEHMLRPENLMFYADTTL